MPDLEELPDAVVDEEGTATTQQTVPSSTQSKEIKIKASKNQLLSTFSIRSPTWSYIRLQHLHSTSVKPAEALDGVTAHLHLTAALSTFLGLHGSAIPIDILKIEDQDLWIRVPSEDRAALIAAVGGWIGGSGSGWRVKGWSCWDVNAFGKDGGQDLF